MPPYLPEEHLRLGNSPAAVLLCLAGEQDTCDLGTSHLTISGSISIQNVTTQTHSHTQREKEREKERETYITEHTSHMCILFRFFIFIINLVVILSNKVYQSYQKYRNIYILVKLAVCVKTMNQKTKNFELMNNFFFFFMTFRN